MKTKPKEEAMEKSSINLMAKVFEQRNFFVDILRKKVGLTLSPLGTSPNEELMDCISEAIDKGCFSVSMVAGLGGDLLTCVLEYINAEAGPRYNGAFKNPQLSVTLRNVSSEPLQIKTGKRIIKDQLAKKYPATVDGRRYVEKVKSVMVTLKPGEEYEIRMNPARAISLLQSNSEYVWSEDFADTHSLVCRENKLVEVKGSLITFDNNRPVTKNWSFLED
jgi:hypothetical protein